MENEKKEHSKEADAHNSADDTGNDEKGNGQINKGADAISSADDHMKDSSNLQKTNPDDEGQAAPRDTNPRGNNDAQSILQAGFSENLTKSDSKVCLNPMIGESIAQRNENVSFGIDKQNILIAPANIEAPLPLKLEGMYFGRITHIVDPRELYFCPTTSSKPYCACKDGYEFNNNEFGYGCRLMEISEKVKRIFMERVSGQADANIFHKDQIVGLKFRSHPDVYVRACILDPHVAGRLKALVLTIDVGTTTEVELSHLIELPTQFYHIAPLVYKCSLYGVIPFKSEQWSESAVQYCFDHLKKSQVLVEIVLKYQSDTPFISGYNHNIMVYTLADGESIFSCFQTKLLNQKFAQELVETPRWPGTRFLLKEDKVLEHLLRPSYNVQSSYTNQEVKHKRYLRVLDYVEDILRTKHNRTIDRKPFLSPYGSANININRFLQEIPSTSFIPKDAGMNLPKRRTSDQCDLEEHIPKKACSDIGQQYSTGHLKKKPKYQEHNETPRKTPSEVGIQKCEATKETITIDAGNDDGSKKALYISGGDIDKSKKTVSETKDLAKARLLSENHQLANGENFSENASSKNGEVFSENDIINNGCVPSEHVAEELGGTYPENTAIGRFPRNIPMGKRGRRFGHLPLGKTGRLAGTVPIAKWSRDRVNLPMVNRGWIPGNAPMASRAWFPGNLSMTNRTVPLANRSWFPKNGFLGNIGRLPDYSTMKRGKFQLPEYFANGPRLPENAIMPNQTDFPLNAATTVSLPGNAGIGSANRPTDTENVDQQGT